MLTDVSHETIQANYFVGHVTNCCLNCKDGARFVYRIIFKKKTLNM